jgi:hypothetical protein
LLAVSCDLRKQRITIPQGDQVFLNVCSRTAGDSTRIFGGPLDEAVVLEPGSQVRLRFNQGTADDGEPALAAPDARVTGTFPTGRSISRMATTRAERANRISPTSSWEWKR